MKKILFTLLLCLFLVSAVQAKNLYVATDGNDSTSYANNDIDNPWLTVKHAFESADLQPADVIHIRSGTYVEARTDRGAKYYYVSCFPSQDGTSGNEIIIQNYANESVTIKSAAAVNSIICFAQRAYWKIRSNPSGGTLTIDADTTADICVVNFGSSYIYIENLVTPNAVGGGMAAIVVYPDAEGEPLSWQNSSLTASYTYIDGCTITGSASHGIKVGQNVDHIYISGNTSYSNTRNGISVSGGDETDPAYVPEYIYIYQNTLYSNSTAGIGINASRYIYVYENKLYSNGSGQAGDAGIYLSDWGTDLDISEINIYRNYIYDNDGGGEIRITGAPSASVTGINIWANLIHSSTCTYDGALVHISSVDGGNVYNNSIYRSVDGAATTAGCLYFKSDCTGTWNVKNNIGIISVDARAAFYNAIEGVTADYNCWRNTADLTDTVYWIDTWYGDGASGGGDIDDYKTDHEANTTFDAPSWKDSTPDDESDFELQSGSPCLDTGANLGATYDDALDPSSSWPASVATLDQDLYGSAWEIGAYVYNTATAALTGTYADGATEAEVVAGTEGLVITLGGDTWQATMGDDVQLTKDLIAGIDSGGGEATGWDAEVKGDGTNHLTHADITRTNSTVVTIDFGGEASYAITSNETITVTVPASALAGSGAVVATPTFEITATSDPAAALTGTLADNATEAQIVTGNETVIITLSNDTWVAAGATFDGERQAVIDGMDSAQSETYGWNAEVRDKMAVGVVVRTNATTVTITLTAAAAYDISANETITVTVPASALVTSGSPVVATPTYSIIFFDTATEEIVGMTLQ